MLDVYVRFKPGFVPHKGFGYLDVLSYREYLELFHQIGLIRHHQGMELQVEDRPPGVLSSPPPPVLKCRDCQLRFVIVNLTGFLFTLWQSILQWETQTLPDQVTLWLDTPEIATTNEWYTRRYLVHWHKEFSGNMSVTAKHFELDRGTVRRLLEGFEKDPIEGLKGRRGSRHRTPRISADVRERIITLGLRLPPPPIREMVRIVREELDAEVSPAAVSKILRRGQPNAGRENK